jgi:6-phosphogluconolactonase
VAWSRVHLWWGDERCVPPDHADSNFRAAQEKLAGRVPIPAENVHRIRGELPPGEAAASYERELARRPLDLVLLGMGADGHTASLFPGGAWLDEAARWAVPARAPVAPHDRVTLTYPALAAARRVVIAVTGAEKRDALRRVLAGDLSLPAARVAGAVWVADAAASG